MNLQKFLVSIFLTIQQLKVTLLFFHKTKKAQFENWIADPFQIDACLQHQSKHPHGWFCLATFVLIRNSLCPKIGMEVFCEILKSVPCACLSLGELTTALGNVGTTTFQDGVELFDTKMQKSFGKTCL